MRRWYCWTLAAIMLMAMVVVFNPVFHPGSRSRIGEDLPWQITRIDDTIQVFGLTLGQTTLASAIDKLGQRYELALFREPNGVLSLEAYFRAVSLGGLSARMVLNLDLPGPALRALLNDDDRGVPMPSGSRRFSLPETPPPGVTQAVVIALTYVPVATVDQPLLDRHLGQPGEQLSGPGDTHHWLYSELGLAVSWEGQQSVFQYIRPSVFSHLRIQLTTPIDVTTDAIHVIDDASNREHS